jgi:predicted transcriptional regulator
MSNPFLVTKDTDCYECYNIMKTHNINYLRVVRYDKILGIIKKSDVSR